MEETTFTDIDFSDFASFIFKLNNVFIEEDKPSEKVRIIEEKLHGIDIDGIRNFQDLSGRVFINEECENLKMLVDGGELTKNANKKKKSEALRAYICPLFDKFLGKSVFTISMWNIVTQLGKHDFLLVR